MGPLPVFANTCLSEEEEGKEVGRALLSDTCLRMERREGIYALSLSLSLSLFFLMVSVLSPLALSGGQTTISEGGDDEEEGGGGLKDEDGKRKEEEEEDQVSEFF